MTRPQFDAAAEARLLKQYREAIVHRRADSEMRGLRRMCLEFSSIVRIGESILDHANSTLWIRDWIGATTLQPSTRAARLWSLRMWWSWLFDQGALDDNVLACFWPVSEALRTRETPMILTCNLQRPIAAFLRERGPGPALSNRQIRISLTHFNVFLNRRGASMGRTPDVDEPFIVDWLRELSRTRKLQTIAFTAGCVTSFLRFLVETGRLRENPLEALWTRYRGQHRIRVIETILARTATPLLPAPEPPFVSLLAPHLQQFLALKRAMGRKYSSEEESLGRFDRFVASRPGAPSATLSRQLVEDWLLAGHGLHPKTKKKRVGLVRQLAIYMVRLDPCTFVPDRTFWPSRIPTFRAYIFSDEEYRSLLKAALELPSPRSPLRPRAIYTLLLVLYATGLRVGEVRRLQLSDVDLAARTFLIRETKFFKSRIVPFSAELAEQLHRYLKIRNAFVPSTPELPFFTNNRRHGFAASTVTNTFRMLLAAAAVPQTPTLRRPRVYDARHTFACTRVLRWYREGADVAAKLPLLATYMGHVSVLSTQTYLNSTAAILNEASHRFEGAFGALVTPSMEVEHEYR